jgi:hypothetical protein
MTGPGGSLWFTEISVDEILLRVGNAHTAWSFKA